MAKSKQESNLVFDRKRQRSLKRDAIITASAQAFHEKGYIETSLDEIAKRLGVTKKTLYYYIDDKNDILREIFYLWLDTQELAVQYAENIEGTASDKIAAYSRRYIASVLSLDAPIDRVANEISALNDEDRRMIDGRRSENDNRLRNIIQEGVDKGEIRSDLDVKITHYTLHGAIDWFFKYFRSSGPLSADQVIDEILKVIFHGIKIPPKS